MLRAILLSLLASTATTGFANDSVFSLGIGGIVFEETDAISMASEDLRISRSRVSVDYVFANRTNDTLSATIGFPLPPLTLGDEPRFFYALQDMAGPEAHFTTLVDGEPIQSVPHMQVTLRDDGKIIDITDILAAYDLLPQNYAFLPDEAAVVRQEDNLVAAARKRDIFGLASRWQHWIYDLTYLWTLDIGAGGEAGVHHEYAPIYGGDAIFPQGTAEPGELAARLAAFCPTADQLRLIEGAGGPEAHDHAGYLFDVDYILTTGANWAGPIGSFRLTLDVEQEGGFPMLCWDGELDQVSPTEWVAEKRDFVPTENIKVGFFIPAQ